MSYGFIICFANRIGWIHSRHFDEQKCQAISRITNHCRYVVINCAPRPEI